MQLFQYFQGRFQTAPFLLGYSFCRFGVKEKTYMQGFDFCLSLSLRKYASNLRMSGENFKNPEKFFTVKTQEQVAQRSLHIYTSMHTYI